MQHCLSTFALASSGGLMLWSEKTTVCRIFSCQRSDGGSTPQALGSVARRARCPLRFLAESPLTVAVSESVNVGSIGALVLSSAWLAEAAPPHLTVQGRRNDSLNNLPDVGGRETQEPHSLTETLSKISPPLPFRVSARQPSPMFLSEGWWRIPGSNR